MYFELFQNPKIVLESNKREGFKNKQEISLKKIFSGIQRRTYI